MEKLRAPYPSDLCIEKVEEISPDRPWSRTRPEARSIAQHHVQGTIRELFEPTEVTPFKKKVTKNFILENKRSASRSSQTRNPIPNKSTRCSSHYKYVQPKVISSIQPLPLKSSCHEGIVKISKNFVQLNKMTAASCIRKDPSDKYRPATSRPSTGKIPKYLLRRRQEWHKHKLEEEAAKPDSTVPDGHVKMSVQDKQITLQTLENDREILIKELMSLPITIHTLKQKQIKADIETKLSEVDDAIKIFSRPKVFIKVDQ